MTILAEPPTTRCPLNPIELAILRHLAEGLTYAQIARIDGPHPSLHNHLARMRATVGVHNTTHLVATALRHGWIA